MKTKITFDQACKLRDAGLTVECYLVVEEPEPESEKPKKRRSIITGDNTLYSFHGASVPALTPGSDLSKACETLINNVFKGSGHQATRAELTAELAKRRKWRKQRAISNIANLRRRDILRIVKL